MFNKKITVYPLPMTFHLSGGKKIRFKTSEEFRKYCIERGLDGYFRMVGPTIGDNHILVKPPIPGEDILKHDYVHVIKEILAKGWGANKTLAKLKKLFRRKPYLKYCIVEHSLPLNPVNSPNSQDMLKSIGYFPFIQMMNVLFSLGKIADFRHMFIKAGAEYKYIFKRPYMNHQIFPAIVKEIGRNILNMKQPGLHSDFDVPLSVGLGQCGCLLDGSDRGEDYYLRLMGAIKYGLDVNRQYSEIGTLLHVLLANEVPDVVSELMNRFEKQSVKVDYTVVDNYKDFSNKTVLLMSVLWNDKKAFDKLLKLFMSKKRVKIGLNTRDSLGGSPLFYAAALGRVEMFQKLLEAGATHIPVTDRNRLSLEDYVNSEKDFVVKIFERIAVHPDRTDGLFHNWLYSTNEVSSPLISNHSCEKHKRILLSHKPEHMKLLLKVQEKLENDRRELAGDGDIRTYLDKKAEVAVMFGLPATAVFEQILVAIKREMLVPRTDQFEGMQFMLKSLQFNELHVLVAGNPKVSKYSKLDSLCFSVNTQIEQVRERPEMTVLEKAMQGKEAVKRIYLEERLRVACILGDLQQVKELVEEQGVNINATGRYGTPLHYCSMHTQVVAKFLKQVVAKFLKDTGKEYKTPDVKEIMHKNIEVFKYLLSQSPDLEIKSRGGRTAIERIKMIKDRGTGFDKAFAQKLFKQYEAATQNTEENTNEAIVM